MPEPSKSAGSRIQGGKNGMKNIILFTIGFLLCTLLLAWLEFAALNALTNGSQKETSSLDSIRTLEYNRKLSEESR